MAMTKWKEYEKHLTDEEGIHKIIKARTAKKKIIIIITKMASVLKTYFFGGKEATCSMILK